MDPTSTVRTDALPALATLVIPGAVASSPYSWIVLGSVPSIASYLTAHDGVAVLVAVVVAIATGFTVDSLGSYVEVYGIDKRRPDHDELLEIWGRYLRSTWSKEPVGHRYLRRLLVTFKFELNMFVAILVALPGVYLLGESQRVSGLFALRALVAMALAGLVFWVFAKGSADVLAKTRGLLVLGVGEPPFDNDGNPSRAGNSHSVAAEESPPRS